jgi:5-methylthioadenosine/S-adenosylhomocysteine deaminase
VRTVISGGVVISMDPVIGGLDSSDVLVENEVIVDVAEHIDASDAVVIDASDCVVIPGFVDTHRHTWQTAFRGVGADWTFAEYLVAVHGTLKPHYQPEDVYVGNLLGRLEFCTRV